MGSVDQLPSLAFGRARMRHLRRALCIWALAMLVLMTVAVAPVASEAPMSPVAREQINETKKIGTVVKDVLLKFMPNPKEV